MVEFLYTSPLSGKLIAVFLLLIAAWWLSRKSEHNTWLRRTAFAISFVLSLLVSQTVLYSGKGNAIDYSVYGITIQKLAIDPNGDNKPQITTIGMGFKRLGYGKQSLVYLSLPCPFCLDLKEMVAEKD